MSDEAMREQLNEVRPVGKNSHGPAGSRQRKNGGKPLTRRLSSKEDARREYNATAMVRRDLRRPVPGNIEKTRALLAAEFDTVVSELSEGALVRKLAGSTNRAMLTDAKKAHRRALSYLYCLYHEARAAHNQEMLLKLVDERVKLRGKDLLTGLAQVALDHEIAGTKEGKRAAQKSRSDHVRAIRWLMKEQVPPYGIEEYYVKNRGGVDQWSRSWAKHAKKTGATDQQENKRVRLEVAARVKHDAFIEGEAERAESYITGTEWSGPKIRKSLAPENLNFILQSCVSEYGLTKHQVMALIIVGDDLISTGARLLAALDIGTHPVNEVTPQMARVMKGALRNALRARGQTLTELLPDGEGDFDCVTRAQYEWNTKE